MKFSAPFESTVMRVEPQWIDYNGHLNMAYYSVLFDRCTDEAFALFGLGPDYVKQKNASFYTLEVHITYLRELMVDAPVRVTLQLLDYDAKRCHIFQEMYHAEEGFLSATSEQISLHVDMNLKKSAPFPDDVLARIKAMREAHADLPIPPQVGHVIGIPRKA
ncbi:thioesterase family protein [Rhodoligotrophos defluvii]|uniref:thioesterase family protein n=1 Tax=Rhodoligotrophos defluvii TaxID=2561934 RepID=UPI0010C9A90F|nr:thioesterase family protein [Rhodoligotrophos defluvii]